MLIGGGLVHSAWCTLKVDWDTVLSASYSVHINSGLVHVFFVQIEVRLLHGARCTLKVNWFMVLSAY